MMNNNLNSWAKFLTKLKVLEIAIVYYSPGPVDFLIRLFESSSNSLTKLVINVGENKSQKFVRIPQQIPLYLHSLNHLELPKILPTELISIFKSCTKLVYLSVILYDDKDLKGLGKFVTKL